MDVKSSFLHGDLFEEILWIKPFALWYILVFFVNWRSICMVWSKLPELGYEKIDHLFLNMGSKVVSLIIVFMYCTHVHGDTLIVVVYVNDLVITGNNIWYNPWIEETTCWTFEMINIGLLHFFLVLQVLPLSHDVFLSQTKYVWDLFKHFKMDDYNPYATDFQLGVKLIKEHEVFTS